MAGFFGVRYRVLLLSDILLLHALDAILQVGQKSFELRKRRCVTEAPLAKQIVQRINVLMALRGGDFAWRYLKDGF
ncbi:hypothetical protein RHOFW104R8_15605 [Rhodanobacter sp. FW104-R8]|nr:hypothetical protein RHOFW104R8_15605 [Rhodanobacter sp. FW104-R8]KZC31933.1 hypothetical protein RhoFW510R10_15460 [Rhodanobacter sp. FW510-R10]